MTQYLEQDPTERAREDRELARLAVPYFHLKRELSRAVPTVLRDLEAREDAAQADSAAL